MTGSFTHGTRSAYAHYRCRCTQCRAAHTRGIKQDRLRRLRLLDRDLVTTAQVVHGKSSTYNNWGCRCDPCRTSWLRYQRTRRALATYLDGTQ